MAAATLNCKQRELGTRGYLNKMKQDGYVPGVIYNKGKENQAILLEDRELKRVFSHSGTRGVFMLQIEGEKSPMMVIIREIQKTPVDNQLSHIDFLPLKSDEKVQNTVNIQIIGEDKLVSEGKMMQVVTKELEILCLPADIPEHITIDVSNLEIGDKITTADIGLPAVIEVLHEPDTVICIVTEPARMDTDIDLDIDQPHETAE